MRLFVPLAIAATSAYASSSDVSSCDPTNDFPVDLSGYQYLGLEHVGSAKDVSSCANACCAKSVDDCKLWQFSDTGCWIGKDHPNPGKDPQHK